MHQIQVLWSPLRRGICTYLQNIFWKYVQICVLRRRFLCPTTERKINELAGGLPENSGVDARFEMLPFGWGIQPSIPTSGLSWHGETQEPCRRHQSDHFCWITLKQRHTRTFLRPQNVQMVIMSFSPFCWWGLRKSCTIWALPYQN